MSIDRYDPIITNYGCGEEIEYWYDPEGKFVYYEDHIKMVDSYIAEIAAAKAEIDKLMLSLELWDEEFK